ncbi:hypothetical protein C8Q80DRAFT_554987 [Daedaleopsis nitida]|nr:hypothetical protein C8Q80DRAFT_554987 [Daedaleopsis nitida]
MTLQEVLDRKLAEIIPRLLQGVVADLRTLSIVHSWEFSAIHLPASFPLLRDLTVCGPPPTLPVPNSRGRSVNGDIVSPQPCFPTLQSLHVVGWNLSFVGWQHHAPQMVLLRLSDLSPSANALPNELHASLGSHDLYATTWTSCRLLQHVRLQLKKPPEYCGLYRDAEQKSFLRQLTRVQTRPSIQLEFMKDRRYSSGY